MLKIGKNGLLVAALATAACGAPAMREPVTAGAEPRPAPSGGGAPIPPETDSRPRDGAASSPLPPLPPRPREEELFALTDAEANQKPLDVGIVQKAWKVKGIGPRPASCSAARATTGPTKEPLSVAQQADAAPLACADALTDPVLSSAGGSLAGRGAHVVVGLSLASKLARTALSPPTMADTKDKEKVKAFIKGPLAKWVVEQATAIETLSAAAVGLRGYGRGIAAISAGVADLRLVDEIRSAPVPKSWDPELRGVYEAALDEALEPRKSRGRDAALVGLADFAQLGVLGDARVASARALLAKLYGGRRIDALDALLLPEWAPQPARAPMYFLANASDGGAPLVGTPFANGVIGRSKCSGAACTDYARARFELGRTYWRRADFVEAAYAAKEAGAEPSARLVLALSATIARGPNGAKEMMAASSPAALGLDKTEALDALAAEGGAMAGMAAYDAAHLRSLSVPEGDAAPRYLRDVATRFKRSADLLGDPAYKRIAEQRARDAEAAAAAADKTRG